MTYDPLERIAQTPIVPAEFPPLVTAYPVPGFIYVLVVADTNPDSALSTPLYSVVSSVRCLIDAGVSPELSSILLSDSYRNSLNGMSSAIFDSIFEATNRSSSVLK